jgi:hypothetical protein
MATNEGRNPNDPRQPHAGEDRTVDPTPSTTDPFGTRPGEVRGDDTLRGAGPRDPAVEPRPVDPALNRADRTYPGSPQRDDRMARPAKRSGTAWAWAIGLVVVIAVVLAFFLTSGYDATEVPVTGAVEEPAPAPVPIDPQADTPVAPAEPIQPQ